MLKLNKCIVKSMHVNRAYTYFNHNEVVLRFHGSASAPFSTFVLIFMSALRNFIFFFCYILELVMEFCFKVQRLRCEKENISINLRIEMSE